MQQKKTKPLDNIPLSPAAPHKEQREASGQFAANMTWLQYNWDKYKDLWIALNNGSLVASGETRADLQTIIDSHENKINIMCLKVGQDYKMMES